MAEIILDGERSLQEQTREVLDLATEMGIGHSQVAWAPRATTGDPLPHGGVLAVPDELAEAHGNVRRKAQPEETDAEASDEGDEGDGTEDEGGEGKRSRRPRATRSSKTEQTKE